MEITTGDLVEILVQMMRADSVHIEGTYNRQDPTQYERWQGAVYMPVGLGPMVVDEDDGYPYPPEAAWYLVDVHDCTWGLTVTVFGEKDTYRMSFYLDFQAGTMHRPLLVMDKKVYIGQDLADADVITQFEKILVVLLTDGRYGSAEDANKYWSLTQEEREHQAEQEDHDARLLAMAR